MKRFRISFVLFFYSVFYSSLLADPSYLRLEELVRKSDLIGVIEVLKTTEDKKKIAPWLYQRKNTFVIIKKYKGAALSTKQTLWSEKNYICARASYLPGKYLVFLKRTPDLQWITLNHELGALRLNKELLLDFSRYSNMPSSKRWPLEKAKQRILEALKK